MQCAICHSSTNMGCSLCQKVFYCSRAHQEKHWLKHKSECGGRVRRVLESEYNTIEGDMMESRKSSPGNRRSTFFSKEKTEEKEMKESIRGKEIQFVERVHRFIEHVESRKDERSKILIEYARGKEDMLVVRAKNLVAFSEGIYKDFDNSMNKTLVEKFKIRTSRYIQQLECFLDQCFIAKLYLKCGMREQLKKQVYSMKLPAIPQRITVLNHKDPDELDAYKLWKQEVKYCKIALSLLAAIANAGGYYSYTESIYKIYIHLIERSFGVNEQFLSYFLVGNWYSEIRQYNKAKACFEYCIELKKGETSEQEILGDCYFNMALCLRMMNLVSESINQMHYSLSIRRRKNGLDAAECLEFIGKQLLELGKYNEATDYLDECYLIRKELLKPNDIAISNVKELIKKLYLKIKQQKEKEAGQFHVRETEELSKDLSMVERKFDVGKPNQHFLEEFGYMTEKNKRIQTIRLDPEWTEWIYELGANELSSLGEIMKKSETLPFDDAILFVLNSDFYKSLSEEKQMKFKELNPEFRFKEQ